jgi:S-adenosylmethionine-dependent methyltransferase
MLAIARRKVEQLDASLLERMDFLCASAEEIGECFPPGHFDVVLCHTLLEYAREPWEVLRGLTMVLRHGGLLSLLLANPYADALRWALGKTDLVKARLVLSEGDSSADLFGLRRRTCPADAAREAMAQAGIENVSQYGVRIFADYLPAHELAAGKFFSQLMDLEMAAGGLDPYRLIGRYVHLLGRKRAPGVGYPTTRRGQEVSG